MRRLAGFMFYFYTACTIGCGVALRAHPPQMRIAIVLTVLTSADALILGVALYAITRAAHADVALLALLFRVVEGVLNAIAAIALVASVVQVKGWAEQVATPLFAIGSALFSYLFLRGKTIPAPVAWLGIISSVLLVIAFPAQLWGIRYAVMIVTIPVLAYELTLGAWLVMRTAP